MLILLLLFLQLPPNIAGVRVGGSAATSLCYESSGIESVKAGETYETVVYVDGGVRYTSLHIAISPTDVPGYRPGDPLFWGYPTNDQAPLCPLDSPNGNTRPHLMPLKVLQPGKYRMEAIIFNGDPNVVNGTVVATTYFTVTQ